MQRAGSRASILRDRGIFLPRFTARFKMSYRQIQTGDFFSCWCRYSSLIRIAETKHSATPMVALTKIILADRISMHIRAVGKLTVTALRFFKERTLKYLVASKGKTVEDDVSSYFGRAAYKRVESSRACRKAPAGYCQLSHHTTSNPTCMIRNSPCCLESPGNRDYTQPRWHLQTHHP